jgi:hypothetical protein
MNPLSVLRASARFESNYAVMATEWYCDLMGKIEGPLTPAQLLQKVKRGEITQDTPIRKNSSKWFPAIEVVGLFEAAFRDKPQQVTRVIETEYSGDY